MRQHQTNNKMSDDDASLGGDVDPLVTSVMTPDEMLYKGLLLANFSEEKQAWQPKSNMRDFVDRYGSKPIVLCCIWEDLQITSYERARVPPEKLNKNTSSKRIIFESNIQLNRSKNLHTSNTLKRFETMCGIMWRKSVL